MFVDTVFTYKTEIGNMKAKCVVSTLEHCNTETHLCIYPSICQNCDDPACTILAALLKVTLIPSKQHVKS